MLFQKQIGTDDNHDECKGIGYMSHAIPQNFYVNYYLLKLLCKCFYGSSEHYGSLLTGGMVDPKKIHIYSANDDELVEI